MKNNNLAYGDMLLNIEQVSEIVGVNYHTLRRRMIECPQDFPLPKHVPGMKNNFYLMSDVVAWMKALPYACEKEKKEEMEVA